ncbi:MAG TPA: hypothetical protein PLK77_07090 [Pyrinomonadaceae bacterium]|nr:hypothetical protein [Pyrinomonadaceae bacterium]
MKTILFASLFVLSLSIFAVTGEAQKKRKPTPRATPKPTPVRTTPTNAVVSSAKQEVSNQLYNVNVFVERLGPIAVAIEKADRDNAARRLSRDDAAANETNKQKVIAAIRVLRGALVNLESDFRTKPQLSSYLSKIQGISTLSADAEDSAIAGKFVAAKDPLREIALKLNDTLAVLPGPVVGGSSAPTRAASTTAVPTQMVSNTTPSTSTARRGPAVGMTTAEVSSSTWGTPTNKRTSTTANGTTEVWTYAGKGTIYFYNGKVTQILR